MTYLKAQTEIIQNLTNQLYALGKGYKETEEQIVAWLAGDSKVDMSAGEITDIACDQWFKCHEADPSRRRELEAQQAKMERLYDY